LAFIPSPSIAHLGFSPSIQYIINPQDLTEKQMQLLHGLRLLAISNWDVGQDPALAIVADDTRLGELPRIFDMICCMKWPLSDGDLRLLLPNADRRNDGL